MTEPEYVFRKGEGWVLETSRYPYIDFTFACGTRCRMIDRNPEPGERYRSAGYDSEFTFYDKTANLSYWSNYISDVTFESCALCKDNKNFYGDTKYVTVIPL